MSYEEENEGRLRRTRKVRRMQAERLPFMPYAAGPIIALGLLVLFAVWPFASGVIERSAERAAIEALAGAGAGWARPRVSGQWITLEGTPPSEEAAESALQAVRQAKARTLLGPARPVTRVRDRFTRNEAAETPKDMPNGWSFRLADGVLTLDGDMPDNDVRDEVLKAARAEIAPPRLISIRDSLTITNEPLPEGYTSVALRGIDTVTRCDRGVASFSSNRFSISCELPGADAAGVREIALAPIALGEIGAVDIMAREAVASCESSLSELLSGAQIKFNSSSAAIDASSSDLLDEVTEAVRACPGNLRIEGHTDSTGLDETNRRLSQARAEAVRNALIARGVPATRLVAAGYGATRPIGSNQTADGRAQNRRIEIRVIRVSE
ncbi:OmpA family protein [Hyphomonas pacifica]|uniref:OmpA family protein n=1 Tax=Hyphomonas pacifica TaxID=1280941 RepID=UPI000DBF81C5|nr:OmpA family protein [Hyphomonas pacifica]RAN35892.1 hypothetical protein HY11_12985 [Hyphomonas pacifica]